MGVVVRRRKSMLVVAVVVAEPGTTSRGPCRRYSVYLVVRRRSLLYMVALRTAHDRGPNAEVVAGLVEDVCDRGHDGPNRLFRVRGLGPGRSILGTRHVCPQKAGATTGCVRHSAGNCPQAQGGEGAYLDAGHP